MSSPSSNSRQSPMRNNQPRLQRQGPTVRVSAASRSQSIAQEAARLTAVTNQIIATFNRNEGAMIPAVTNQATATFDPNNFIRSMDAALNAMRAVTGGEPDRLRRIRRIAHIIANVHERTSHLSRGRHRPRYAEDGIPNPPPPYTALPPKGEVTIGMALPEPAYTPPCTPFGQGQKRKREEDVDNEEDGDVADRNRGFIRLSAPSPQPTVPQRATRSTAGFAVEDDGDVSDGAAT
ncbi:hypothetical protein N0V85_008874 [Neurospora sp. IMI 360204]|nr:hypothetical protein N0V85_008874 [Neurospora sp. IMI 360204]